MTSKANKETTEARLAEIESAMVQLWPRSRLERHFGKAWGVSPRQVRNYMKKVRDRNRAAAEAMGTPEEIQRARRDMLREAALDAYRHARSRGDIKACFTGLRFLADFDGLSNPVQVEVEGKLKHEHGASDYSELRNIVMGLKAVKSKEGE